MSVTGGKEPGGWNSTAVPTASPVARPIKQPRNLEDIVGPAILCQGRLLKHKRVRKRLLARRSTGVSENSEYESQAVPKVVTMLTRMSVAALELASNIAIF